MPNYDEDYDTDTAERFKRLDVAIAKAKADAETEARKWLVGELKKVVPSLKYNGDSFECDDHEGNALRQEQSRLVRSGEYKQKYVKELNQRIKVLKL